MAKKSAKDVSVNPEDIPDVEELPGYEFLTPVYRLRPSKAARIVGAVAEDGRPMDQLSDALEAIEEYAVEDEEGFLSFYREAGIEAVLTLAMAYVGKLAGALS